MSEHLLKAGANITPREGDELARLPYLRTWFRTRSAIILHLSNGCVQINFFQVSCGRGGLGPGICASQRPTALGGEWEARDLSLAASAEGSEMPPTTPISWDIFPLLPPRHTGSWELQSPVTPSPSTCSPPALTGPHQTHPVPADGCGDLHRREAGLPHVPPEPPGGVRLLQGAGQPAALRPHHGGQAAEFTLGHQPPQGLLVAPPRPPGLAPSSPHQHLGPRWLDPVVLFYGVSPSPGGWGGSSIIPAGGAAV